MDATELQKLLKSRRTEDKIKGVTALAKSDAPDRFRLFFRLLDDSSHYVAALAAEALKECTDWGIASDMTDKFLALSEGGAIADPGCHIRGHLAFALGKMEFHGAVNALRIGIRTKQIEAVAGVRTDTAGHLRANCALALAYMRAPDALRDITLVLFDISGYMPGDNIAHLTLEPRKAAAQAMAMLGDRNALIPLTLRLTYPQNEVPEVLQECMQAVVDLEDDRAVELLSPYLKHRDTHLAAYAALMIARTQSPEAAGLMMEVIERLQGDPLRAVVMAFNVLRSEAAREVLRALAADRRDEVRVAVVEALADSMDEADKKCLSQLAKSDKSAIVRNAAKRAVM